MSDSALPAVLLVDDTRTSLLVMQKALESEDYRVVTASNATEALALLEDTSIFLAILDVNLPDMTGFDLAQQFSARNATRRLPVIFLTAMDQQQELTFQGYEAGAVDFMYKPARPMVLRSKVQVFLELYTKARENEAHLAAAEEANKKFAEELRERKRMELAVQESEVRYRSLLELSPVSIVVETNGRMSYLNTAVLKLLGEEDRDTVARHSLLHYVTDKQQDNTRRQMNKIISQGGRAQPFETELLRPDGRRVDVEIYSACVMYEGEVGVQMALQDVTERKLLEAEWRRLSRMDGLTGIYNRRAFDELIERELRRAQRNRTSLALALIDIDAFKLFNDNYGHQQGDEALKKVALALKQGAVRGGDHVARYGGEEFAAIMADTDIEGAVRVAESLRHAVEALAIPHEHNPAAAHVTISIGVYAVLPEDRTTTAELVQRADACLYKAKRTGRNRVVQHDAAASTGSGVSRT